MKHVELDDGRVASLDGEWEFYPGEHNVDDLDRLPPIAIQVPALWEAHGHLDLDGTAWYRRRFRLDDASGSWTLRFGAVMDFADVFLNGVRLGSHEQPFTPFEVDAAPALRAGENDLAVRVVDPSLHDSDHVRMAHGKQGWANDVFPSRPSLYMTYGGIWQPVTLRRHGQVVVDDVFVEGHPDDLVISASVQNRGEPVQGRIGVRTLGLVEERTVELPAGGSVVVEVRFGQTSASWWRPEHPALHGAVVDVWSEGSLSDSRSVRYGVRTISVEEGRLLLNGEPYRMKSALVQGFHPERLYAEGTRAEIEDEVRAARAMGFNTLRLHLKAFDPAYLDVCDELGMLVHCDIPVAEPIAHEEMGDASLLTRRCVAAAREQVRRDRNHPSIILWSAMNEIPVERPEARGWSQYESFVRGLFAAIRDEDPTRPVIENDWVEPAPERVFRSPILTAHWYGRLHREYLEKIDAAAARWADLGRPLLVTEFGDWGLPTMPVLAEPPFWDTRAVHAAGAAEALWPASLSRFVWETQRYQGLSDRLQAEVFRRHDHIGGYCLTELTDVPFELNGLLDVYRRPKRPAVEEVTRGNQVVLPMLRLDTLVLGAGELVRAPLFLSNDGAAIRDVTVDVGFGDASPERNRDVMVGDVPAHAVVPCRDVLVAAPDVEGNHDLVLSVRSGGSEIAGNRYPIHVVRVRRAELPVRVLGSGAGGNVLREIGAVPGEIGPFVVTEGGMDAEVGERIRGALADGEVVLVLAQSPASAERYPVATELEPLDTGWGSTLFRFTTDHGALPSLPRRNLLVAEDSSFQATSVVSRVEGSAFPDTPVVIAYKPVPG
ncbi:MAG: hypothetical protein M3144_07800, partial [Actinomycetota bacterium]|nr:hypothetical protein [Actinomycetota bacterium]